MQDYSATTAAVVLCQPEGYLFAESERVLTVQNYWVPSVESRQSKRQPTGNPTLEMRSVNRSLPSKAREEMSDFEREYPW
jgi:hypothetical protein